MVYRFDPKRGKLERERGALDQDETAEPVRAISRSIPAAGLRTSSTSSIRPWRFCRTTAAQGPSNICRPFRTLPEGFAGESTCADIHVSPSGTFVYASNRGHDSIVIYRIDPLAGRLGYVGHEPTQGKTPRSFGIDPTGRFLLVANQDSDSVVTLPHRSRTVESCSPRAMSRRCRRPCA